MAQGDHVREIQIVDFAQAVIAGPAGVVQAAAQIHHRGPGMGFQIIPHLPGQIRLAHGHFQKAEAMHQPLGTGGQGGKIIIDFLHQGLGAVVPEEPGVQLGTHLPAVQGDDQGFLHGVFLNGNF